MCGASEERINACDVLEETRRDRGFGQAAVAAVTGLKVEKGVNVWATDRYRITLVSRPPSRRWSAQTRPQRRHARVRQSVGDEVEELGLG